MGSAALAAIPCAPGVSAEEMTARSALRARPDFPQIARQTVLDLSRAYQGNLLLTRLLNDRARIVLALLMLDLNFEPPDAPGLTVGRLKTEATALGLCSPGRVAAILAAARLLGLVTSAPDVDRRRRRLVVTPRLIEIHKERWRTVLGAMRPAFPEGEIGLAHLDDPRFLAAFVAALLRPFRAGWRIGQEVPWLRFFADRDGGLLVAFALYEAAHTGTPLAVAPLARNFRVSRSHVADILAKAAEAGLVERVDAPAKSGPGFLAKPPLIDAIEAFSAIALVRQAYAVREALAALPPPE